MQGWRLYQDTQSGCLHRLTHIPTHAPTVSAAPAALVASVRALLGFLAYKVALQLRDRLNRSSTEGRQRRVEVEHAESRSAASEQLQRRANAAGVLHG